MASMSSTPNQPTQTNTRAEDIPPHSRWIDLLEGVFIPIGSIFAIFLFMLGIMLVVD